jgi:hypothetical protein
MGPGALLDATGITLRYPNGHVARGTIRERIENRRVVFGYGYENGENGLPVDASTVTIDLEPIPGGTLLVFRHEGLDEPQSRAHRMGWNHYLAQLASAGAEAGIRPILREAIARYMEAWNGSAPLAALEACWTEDGVYRDRMSVAAGRAALAGHIAMAQRYMPGVKLELAGEPDQVLGHVRFSWRIRQADGESAGEGQCFGRLRPSGHFTELTGFWNT